MYNTYDHYREISTPIPEDHDTGDLMAAMQLAFETETQYLGIFYRDTNQQSYSKRLQTMRTDVQPLTMADIMKRYVR